MPARVLVSAAAVRGKVWPSARAGASEALPVALALAPESIFTMMNRHSGKNVCDKEEGNDGHPVAHWANATRDKTSVQTGSQT